MQDDARNNELEETWQKECEQNKESEKEKQREYKRTGKSQ